MEALKGKIDATKLRASKLQEPLVSQFPISGSLPSPQKFIFDFSHDIVFEILPV